MIGPKNKDLKKGDLYYVRWRRDEFLLSFSHLDRQRHFDHTIWAVFEVLATTGGTYFDGNTMSPDWKTATGWKKISVEELPLYLYLPCKLAKFSELLRGE